VFSIAYALSAPFAGLFIDRVGLNLGLSLAVGLWSLAARRPGGRTALERCWVCEPYWLRRRPGTTGDRQS
jgi:hypothetical protein